MAAYKVKGKVDAAGQLIITEAIDLPPGDVEILVFPTQQTAEPQPTKSARVAPTKIKSLKNWFEKTEPAPADFDADDARWEALKEKYGL